MNAKVTKHFDTLGNLRGIVVSGLFIVGEIPPEGFSFTYVKDFPPEELITSLIDSLNKQIQIIDNMLSGIGKFYTG